MTQRNTYGKATLLGTPTAGAAEGSLTDTAATGLRRFYRIDISIPDRP